MARPIFNNSIFQQLVKPLQPSKLINHHLPFFNLRSISTPSDLKSIEAQVPQWLKELEINQNSKFLISCLNESGKLNTTTESTNNGPEDEASGEVVIYRAKMKNDWRGSPNRVGMSVVGLLIASGYFAQQIRHHGAGPTWPDAKSEWSDYQLVPWHPTTRFLIASSIITFTTYRAFTFLLTLSHTIRKITIPRGIKLITPTTDLKLYSIASQDLIWPLNQFFPPLISSPSQLLSFGRLTNRTRPLKPHTVPALGPKAYPGALIPLKPIPSGLAFQLPLDGAWGSPDLEPQVVKASL
ncbi:hypothetical protein CROQUDRAFT_130987 [Cronartium quercuum f. sp. fusiforme G11]|uniref:Uncharacterized protein n=1 Tax=Cronartium quercuum f. sp. fusiforme G11 TaxID=708437 RepID=A0A9P6TFK3_9BASI|nr:hypothetical protein CROQUDRAFT_130987 [Cronartium quercuum f. sp. fusiforme G11]